LLSPLLLGERIRRRDFLYLTVVAAGLVLCFAAQPAATATAPDPATGNLLGVMCSLAWAATLMALRWAERGNPGAGMSAVIVGNVMACLAGLPFALPMPVATAGEWGTLVYLGVVQIAIAYVFLTRAFRRLSALEVSLLLLLEPVLNPIWTWLVRGEEPGPWVALGGALIVVGTGLKAVYDSRSAPVVEAAK
jgi:drug/metabolite transporter (DMT)-like permease